MSKTSAKVKNRYNAKAYERVTIVIKKDAYPAFKAHADKSGGMGTYIKRLISADMGGVEL